MTFTNRSHPAAGGLARPAAPPSQQHTGAVVPIWGRGPGAAAILGTTDHTDLFKVLTPPPPRHRR